MIKLTINDVKQLKNILDFKDTTKINEYISKYSQNEKNIVNFKNFIRELFSNKTIDKENELLLTISKLLWNELEPEDNEWVYEIGLISYLLGKLEESHFIALWKRFREKGLLTVDEIVHLAWLTCPKESTFLEFLDFAKVTAEKFGSDLLNLGFIVEVYEQLSGNPDNIPIYWKELASSISSLLTRPEYFQDMVDSLTDKELVDLVEWLPWKLRKKCVNQIIDRKLTSVQNGNELKKVFRKDTFLKMFPAGHTVLGEKLELLEANPITDDTFTNVPQQFISDWAPKFVYGSIKEPERDPHIQIYFPGGRHIGHSAILVKTRIGSVLLDFGMSVVNNAIASWHPILPKVDAVLLSHAHGDHSGAIPSLMQFNKSLPVITRKETKTLVSRLWWNGASIIKRNYEKSVLKENKILKAITTKNNINSALENIYELKIKEQISVLPNFDITSYDASHLFGSVGFELNIAGKRLFYTGDFNADGTRMFSGVHFPSDVDTFIFDGTYYNRAKTEVKEYSGLTEILQDAKRVLIPAFALGRSQEILYELKKLKAYKDWKIIMTGMGGKLASELNVISGMGKPTQNKGLHIAPTINEEEFTEKTIVIAGQGMLQNGTSRKLLDATASDEETSIVFCGFQAPGTIGNNMIARHPYLIKKYKQRITNIKLSGHTSSETLDKILQKHHGKKIIVHAPTTATIKKNDDIIVPKPKKSFKM